MTVVGFFGKPAKCVHAIRAQERDLRICVQSMCVCGNTNLLDFGHSAETCNLSEQFVIIEYAFFCLRML